MRRCLIVGNCQVKSLCYALAHFFDDVEFEYSMIHSLPKGREQSWVDSQISLVSGRFDLVLAFVLSDRFLDFSVDRIRETFNGISGLTISNLYFGGYHTEETSERQKHLLSRYVTMVTTVRSVVDTCFTIMATWR